MNPLNNPVNVKKRVVDPNYKDRFHGEYDNHKFVKMYDEKYGQGIIDVVSPQGDTIFIRARKLSTTDKNGKMIQGEIIGNLAKLPEKDLTMSECLIPLLDYKPWEVKNSGYSELVGLIVKVKYVGGVPAGAYLSTRATTKDSAREITSHDIWNARSLETDKKLTKDKKSSSYRYLSSLGYSNEIIDATIEDSVDQYGNGDVLSYKQADWNFAAQKEMDTLKSVPDPTISITTGLPGSQLKAKPCHYFFRGNRG